MKQMSFEGGFQGRTNKLVDGCYSFWQGAIFPILHTIFSKQGWWGVDRGEGRKGKWVRCHKKSFTCYVMIAVNKKNNTQLCLKHLHMAQNNIHPSLLLSHHSNIHSDCQGSFSFRLQPCIHHFIGLFPSFMTHALHLHRRQRFVMRVVDVPPK